MQHYIGLSEYDLRQKRIQTPIAYEPQTLINGHLLMSGSSGAGKSWQAREFLASAIASGIEIDVFDAHNEFGDIPGSTVCIFSQATGYGYNPLVLDTDEHTGGVNSQVDFFVRLIKNVTPQFGIKQEMALRNLLVDTYAMNGITQEDRRSWHKQSINEATREGLIKSDQRDKLNQCYPTIEDLKTFAKDKLIGLTIGADNQCVTAFEQLTRFRKKLDKLMKDHVRAVGEEEIKKVEEMIKKQKQKCIETYTSFIEAMESGREIDDILKYDSVDVLTSVLQRLTLLGNTGILSANEPPFNGARVRIHQIKSLSPEQQFLYVKLRLQDVFDRCNQMGTVQTGTPPRHIVFLDEAHKYFTPDASDIINVISKEARKFGLGLWCASQQPTEFPEGFLTNCGATILLGIHTTYWKRAASMFRISEESLMSIKPKEVMAVKMLKDGCVDPPFFNVVVPNPNSQMGQIAAAFSGK